jgi:hypothetical protein
MKDARLPRLLIAALLCALTPIAGSAQTSPGTASECSSVVAILPVGGSDPRATQGRDFEAILRSPGDATTVTGTLWINASGSPYHVPVVARGTISKSNAGDVDPIAFRLPHDAVLESAFVDTVVTSDGSEPIACKKSVVWTPSVTKRLRSDLFATFSSAHVPEFVTAEAIDNPVAACHFTDFPPATLDVAPVGRTNVELVLPRYDVLVRVSLNADSSLADATISKSANVALNDVSLDAARRSVYRTKIHQCLPEAAAYLFVVSFQGALGR